MEYVRLSSRITLQEKSLLSVEMETMIPWILCCTAYSTVLYMFFLGLLRTSREMEIRRDKALEAQLLSFCTEYKQARIRIPRIDSSSVVHGQSDKFLYLL